MSHFSVAVITKGKPTESIIADMLAPYDENLEVEHTISREELIQRTRDRIKRYQEGTYAEYLRDPDEYERQCSNPAHLDYLKNEFPLKLKWSDEQCYQDAISDYPDDEIMSDGSIRSTYNPDSKWDWYEIGGRWNGLLTINPRSLPRDELSKDGIVVDESVATIHVNSARIKDILFLDNEEKYRNAERFWELYIEGQDAKNPEEAEMVRFVWRTKEYYLKAYKDKKTYAECQSSFGTYAVVTEDGKWHEQGQMGWWGISSNDDEVGWARSYKSLVFDNASEDSYLTIVDCHI